jgi:hypothetical protein
MAETKAIDPFVSSEPEVEVDAETSRILEERIKTAGEGKNLLDKTQQGTKSPKTIFEFLKTHRHQGFCDTCIAKKTGIDRGEVYTITATLAMFPDRFRKVRGICGCASAERWITTAE